MQDVVCMRVSGGAFTVQCALADTRNLMSLSYLLLNVNAEEEHDDEVARDQPITPS